MPDIFVFTPYLPRFTKKNPPWSRGNQDFRCLFFPRIYVYDTNLNKKHWVLFTVFPKERQIVLYNSVRKCLPPETELRNIRRFLYEQRKKKFLPILEYLLCYVEENIPQQSNNYDCGLFVMEFMRRLAWYVKPNAALTPY